MNEWINEKEEKGNKKAWNEYLSGNKIRRE